jgi:hypothetical protein
MTMAVDSALNKDHPAPDRDKARLGSLSFGLAAPPLAWSVQSIVGYWMSTRACYPGDTPRIAPAFSGLREMLLATNGLALLIGVVALSIAYRNWRATRRETGGESTELIEEGEGRTRFLAMCGILVAAGFFVATAFTSITLWLSPLCR